MQFQHLRLGRGVAKYLRMFYPSYICMPLYDDIVNTAIVAGYETYINGGDYNEVFTRAKDAAKRLLEDEIRQRRLSSLLTVEKEELDILPILPICRTLYRKLKLRKGKRRVKSAVIKAFVLQQKLIGCSLREISYMLETTNHGISYDNVKKHYRSACALVFGIEGGNIKGERNEVRKDQRPR